MRKCLFLISLALSSVACSQSGDERPTPPAEAQTTAIASAKAGTAGEAAAVSFKDHSSKNGGNREFSYSWPKAVSEIPQLVERFTAERDRELAAQKADWEKSFDGAPEDCISCISRGFEKEWKVVAELPQWLSLSADLYVYTGGAHGNSGKISLVWDKRGQRAMKAVELFNSPVALQTAIGTRLCETLNEQREERRGMSVDPASGDLFVDCPGLDEATVLVGSSSGESFDRVGIYFGPYVAGPYAEGEYELIFTVTPSILDAVRPEFSSAFSVVR